jgi:hypothetical protein
MKKSLLIAILLLLGIVSPVRAQSIDVEQIPVSEEGRSSKIVYLQPGFGVTIKFDKADEIIKKAWLDNSSFVGLDTDTDINENLATAIHLREIDAKPVNNLEKIRAAQLTVITTDRNNKSQVYLFDIRFLGSQPSNKVSLIEYVRSATDKLDSERIIKNISLAKEQGIIASRDLIDSTQKLVNLLKSGMNPEEAAKKANISPRFLRAMNRG